MEKRRERIEKGEKRIERIEKRGKKANKKDIGGRRKSFVYFISVNKFREQFFDYL